MSIYDFLPNERECMDCHEVKSARNFSVIKHWRNRTPQLFSYCKPCQSLRVKTARMNKRRRDGVPTWDVYVRRYTFNGKTQPISLWIKDDLCLASELCIRARIRAGWDFADAMTLPKHSKKPQRTNKMNTIQTTIHEDHLIDISRDSATSFHGGEDSRSDLRHCLKYRGYTSFDWGSYEDYEEASVTLVEKGLATVSNGWFNLTDSGLALAQELFETEV